jgi:tetratricopeptide (TPR) repeat protein
LLHLQFAGSIQLIPPARSLAPLGNTLRAQHELAIGEAEQCLKRDPDFIKGYYRLGSELLKLDKHDEALAVCQMGLKKAPGHQDLRRLLLKCMKSDKDVAEYQKARQSAGQTTKDEQGRKVNMQAALHDERADQSELKALQEKEQQAMRGLREVQQELQSVAVELKAAKLSYLVVMPAERQSKFESEEAEAKAKALCHLGHTMYRGVGRMFLREPEAAMQAHCGAKLQEVTKRNEALLRKGDFLAREVKSIQANAVELGHGSYAS